MKKYTSVHKSDPTIKIKYVDHFTQIIDPISMRTCRNQTLFGPHSTRLYVVQNTRTCDYFARGKTTFILVYDVRMYLFTPKADNKRVNEFDINIANSELLLTLLTGYFGFGGWMSITFSC